MFEPLKKTTAVEIRNSITATLQQVHKQTTKIRNIIWLI